MCCVNDDEKLKVYRAKTKPIAAWKIVQSDGDSMYGFRTAWRSGRNTARSPYTRRAIKELAYNSWSPSGFHAYLSKKHAISERVQYAPGGCVVVPVLIDPKDVMAVGTDGWTTPLQIVARRITIEKKEWVKAGVDRKSIKAAPKKRKKAK